MSQAPVFISLANDEPLIDGAKRKRYTCNFKDCEKLAVQGGVCCEHGAKRKKTTCNFKDCEKWAVNGGVCCEHGAERKYTCNFKDCEKLAVKEGVCCKHGAKRKKTTCNFKDCEKWAVKGGVCRKHGAERTICNFKDCEKVAVNGGVCNEHGAKRTTCNFKDCEKFAVKGGVCCEHGAERTRTTCNFKDCEKWAVKGGVCCEHGANRKDNAKEISKHIPIVADSLARIFARVGYAYAQRITSEWENSSNDGNSGGNKSNSTFSMPNDALGQVHTIRSLPHVLAEISEQSIRIDCLRVPFERRLRSLYPCDDEEFGETTGNTSNDCVTGPFCRPCLMHEHM